MMYAQPRKMCWLIILISLVSMLQGCAAKSTATGKQQGTLVLLNKIDARDVDGKTEITIEGTEPILQYTSFQLTEPLRLVVDISDTDIGRFQNKIPMNSGAIIDITPSQKDNIARLEIALSQSVDSKVNQVGGKLVVELAKPSEVAKTTPETITTTPQPELPTAPTAAPAPEKVESPQPEAAAATVVSTVRASAGKDGVKVVITGNGVMSPKTKMLKDNRLVIDIPGVKSKVKPNNIPVRKGGLMRVRIGQHEHKVSVVLDLTKPLEYTVTPEGNTLVIAMGVPGVPRTEVKPEEKLSQERAAQELAKSQTTEKEVVSQQGNAPVPPPAAQERAEPAPQPTAATETPFLSNESRSKEKRISLDLQDADLVNVMRLFAELADLNIILAPNVKGRVTVRMVNIPWDQAMDIILKMNGLGRDLEGNVLRIALKDELKKQYDDEAIAKEAKKKAEDLITRIIPINYSTASVIETTIKKSLSARGETVTDARTNTLIVKDIARNVDDVVSLIKLLDKPIPQVMIEARIVEASLNFNRTIGVQWGASLKAGAGTNNSTGYAFPNSIGITGGAQMGPTQSGNGNYFVNMPAAAGAGTGGGAVGFTFGSLSKALNLDLVLSAIESTGEGKVISTPRVSALDNKEAKIEQGISIPFSTTSSAGTQIQFIDAKLSLIVTPHATPDNKIFMKIFAQKNAPDTSLLGASGQPSIRKNEATTEILLADGETAVIGGILIIDRGVTIDKIPFLGDLPLIGWLFSRKSTQEQKRELIIFITPRIVRQEVI